MDQRGHLAVGRESTQLELAEHLAAVDEDLESPPLGLLELDLRPGKGPGQLGGQTGRLGFVVSLHAVLDGELH